MRSATDPAASPERGTSPDTPYQFLARASAPRHARAMEHTTLGTTDITIPRLCIGGMSFGKVFPDFHQ